MTKYREGIATGMQRLWETQACEEAARLGLSEAKVIRRVEKELIRIVAEKIATHQITRRRAQLVASREAADQPSIEAKKTVHREKVSMPGATTLDDAGDLIHDRSRRQPKPSQQRNERIQQDVP